MNALHPVLAHPENPRRALPGALLIASTLLSVFLMAHHPHVAPQDIGAAVAEMVQKAAASKVVHGGLIALLGVQAFALLELSATLGFHRAVVRAAALAYVAGCLAMIGAALISGFLLPNVALHFRGVTGDALAPLRYVFGASALANRTLATFATIAMSAGIGLWSLALARAGRQGKLLAALGLVVALAPAAAILAGALALEVDGMTLVVLVQGAWNIAVGVALARRARLTP